MGKMAIALVAVLCAGCGSWTGFGFRADGEEMMRLRQAMSLKQGMTVADVGAGKGQLTLALAREVGPTGRVFATEIDAARLQRLREARLGNVTVVEAGNDKTGLPAECCDAVVLRRVYHHLSDPAAVNASLLQALRPGGALVVIDFPPPFFWTRGSLGVPAEDVIEELKRGRFELVRVERDWPGRGPLGSYCALFRKPIH